MKMQNDLKKLLALKSRWMKSSKFLAIVSLNYMKDTFVRGQWRKYDDPSFVLP